MDEANLHGFFGVRARTTIVCQLAADLRLGCIRQIHSIRPIRLLAIAFVSAFRPLMRGAFALQTAQNYWAVCGGAKKGNTLVEVASFPPFAKRAVL